MSLFKLTLTRIISNQNPFNDGASCLSVYCCSSMEYADKKTFHFFFIAKIFFSTRLNEANLHSIFANHFHSNFPFRCLERSHYLNRCSITVSSNTNTTFLETKRHFSNLNSFLLALTHGFTISRSTWIGNENCVV